MRPRCRRIQLHYAREFGARFREMLCRRQVEREKRSGRRVDRIQVDSPAEKLDRSIDVSACYLEMAAAITMAGSAGASANALLNV